MKIKLGELAQKTPSLIKLGGIDLPAITAFKVKGIADKLEPHKSNYDEQMRKLFTKFGEEKDGQYIIKQDKAKQFLEERNKLDELEIEIETSEVEITLTNDITLSARDISMLSGLIYFKIDELEGE